MGEDFVVVLGVLIVSSKGVHPTDNFAGCRGNPHFLLDLTGFPTVICLFAAGQHPSCAFTVIRLKSETRRFSSN